MNQQGKNISGQPAQASFNEEELVADFKRVMRAGAAPLFLFGMLVVYEKEPLMLRRALARAAASMDAETGRSGVA